MNIVSITEMLSKNSYFLASAEILLFSLHPKTQKIVFAVVSVEIMLQPMGTLLYTHGSTLVRVRCLKITACYLRA